jgi:peptide chain release factor 1
MLEKIAAIEKRYEELTALLEQNAEDYQKVAELAKERSEIEPVVVWQPNTMNSSPNKSKLASWKQAMTMNCAISQVELSEVSQEIEKSRNSSNLSWFPKIPRDDRNVFMEIRAGAGGDEAGLFAADLLRMYMHYAELHRWNLEMVSSNETGIGGYKEVIFMVKGKGAYSRLKFESGVHRVQRIPATESSGRIYTSTVTVAVMAEIEDIEINIPESDIDVMFSVPPALAAKTCKRTRLPSELPINRPASW